MGWVGETEMKNWVIQASKRGLVKPWTPRSPWCWIGCVWKGELLLSSSARLEWKVDVEEEDKFGIESDSSKTLSWPVGILWLEVEGESKESKRLDAFERLEEVDACPFPIVLIALFPLPFWFESSKPCSCLISRSLLPFVRLGWTISFSQRIFAALQGLQTTSSPSAAPWSFSDLSHLIWEKMKREKRK